VDRGCQKSKVQHPNKVVTSCQNRVPHTQLIAGAITLAYVAVVAAQTDSGLLWRTHQWFELRETATKPGAPLISGALAAVFNDPERAEQLLGRVIRESPRSDAADNAYALLARIYIRSGQYERFITLYDAWAAAIPGSEALRAERENYDKFRGRPNQINGPRRRSVLRRSGEGYPTLPVSIDGKTDDFIFDTGAWQSAMTETEARKLGLTIRDDGRVLTDIAGTRVRFRTALVKEVVLGEMRFRNVSFAVIESGGVFADAEIGIIGMPMILAIGGINWSRDGTVEFGAPLPELTAAVPNLAFDHHRLVLRTQVLGKPVVMTLDTGANTTSLNANVAAMFPEAVAKGKKGTDTFTGVGGAKTFESIDLPGLVFSIGSSEVSLKPAIVTMQRVATAGGECCVGNAGHDLLQQGRGFTIDLTTMTLQLR
jgi:predicted aspartyl protease